VVVLAATVAVCGCGPIEYLSQVSNKAAAAVAAAKLAQADRYAPYEYTAAEEYLHKAREEAGYAQYQDAIEYGRRSEELANRARAMAIAHLSEPVAGGKAGGRAADQRPPERGSPRESK
jgi:hypothetical protein